MVAPFTLAERTAIAAIENLYKTIPSMACRPGCHACCGVVLMSDLEQRRIGHLAFRNQEGLTCPYLGKDGCRVYDRRPAICRLFGTMETLKCPKGCQPPTGFMSPARGPEILDHIQHISDMTEGR